MSSKHPKLHNKTQSKNRQTQTINCLKGPVSHNWAFSHVPHPPSPVCCVL